MLKIPTLTPRQYLIVAHDLIATAVAIVASFFIRFEWVGLEARYDTLLRVLPAFLVYAGFIYFLFGLHAAKWRFTSLPDLFNIFRASTVLALSLGALYTFTDVDPRRLPELTRLLVGDGPRPRGGIQVGKIF